MNIPNPSGPGILHTLHDHHGDVPQPRTVNPGCEHWMRLHRLVERLLDNQKLKLPENLRSIWTKS